MIILKRNIKLEKWWRREERVGWKLSFFIYFFFGSGGGFFHVFTKKIFFLDTINVNTDTFTYIIN